jgi:hypothetical protein
MPAFATVQGQRCPVRITRDLVDNWAIDVMPPPPAKSKPALLAPLFTFKVKADNWQAAAFIVLKGLKDSGKIDDFESDPVPPKPVRKSALEEDEAAE